MKIGIITFHYGNNFGAVLQCYGLLDAIADMGFNAEVIDYIPRDGEIRPFWRGWNLRSGWSLRKARKRLNQLRFQRRASARFENFRRLHTKRSRRCRTPEELNGMVAKYDAVVCGSDQVWVFDRPTPYFLDLGNEFAGRKVSYAACCGHPKQRPDLYGRIKELVNHIDSVSVRNEFSRQLIAPMLSRPIAIVADPSLLVNYDKIMQKRSLPCDDYILIYSLSSENYESHAEIVSGIQRTTGNIPVVDVVSNSSPAKHPCAQHHIFDASPEEWIWLIANARFVYTDSFHGALFCIKYRVPFLVDLQEGQRSARLLDAARRYGFEDRCVRGTEDVFRADTVCEFDDPIFRIAKHVEDSIRFLRKALAA